MISTIKVDMLGGLSVWADGSFVLDNAAKVTKPWQVFCYLVLNRTGPIPATKLISALWQDEDLTDPANVLKNTIYMLRREFKAAKDTRQSPILFEKGGYLCNPNIRFELDAEHFEQRATQALAQAKEQENAADKQCTQALSDVVDLYKGELLPQLDGEAWVMPLSLYYRQLFKQCTEVLCKSLYSSGRYNELLAAATTANRIDPLEESYYTYMFRALYELKMYRAIIPAYHKTARIFSEELGATLCEEIQNIAKAAGDKVDLIEQDIMIIKDELREITQGSGPVNGPLYCTYDVFKYLYQMVARSSNRAGGSVMIVLLTIKQCGQGIAPTKLISSAMAQVKALILGGLLRKTDVVSRYSKSQYIIMLSVEKLDSAETIKERIQKKCATFLEPSNLEVVFATTELEFVEE